MNPDGITKKKVMLYPLWLRLWHWSNALMFTLLLLSGISLHFSDPDAPVIGFATARVLHNVCGLFLTMGFVWFIVANWLSDNLRHYRPVRQNFVARLLKQADFYARGIFLGQSHPFPATWGQKFNPLQQMTYLLIMYLVLPVIIVTGFMLWVPEWAPEQILGMDGLWPAAVLHYLVGVALAVFFVGHVYLVTIGKTMTSQIEKMLSGWEEIRIDKENDHERR
ncbi:MAG: cytochrome b/b6 domain-containing protein [Magnetococcales bacterium]|nr:cytochrome b/b6 domain-containing protein [Magnetococcales bacterium]MBF0149133.1 cytochrome b/b6 domain-containing protein [Magnetococcales bacterium]MBF0173220.1 cytochrome b/b6 domain-containing protein [Magnetococcales bacterium]MBF0348921.1 cytochrome b/b6 domain-containing protein [Magnetococcales bacterium]MBF0632871.1 cytochrome b/b6 domain-containing protein [Magnetococcales bacterium]